MPKSEMCFCFVICIYSKSMLAVWKKTNNKLFSMENHMVLYFTYDVMATSKENSHPSLSTVKSNLSVRVKPNQSTFLQSSQTIDAFVFGLEIDFYRTLSVVLCWNKINLVFRMVLCKLVMGSDSTAIDHSFVV